MLIRITKCCHEQCSHCMVNASPEGEHMPLHVAKDAICFVNRSSPILLTGGEPTLHPDFMKIAEYAIDREHLTILLSNGMWVLDQEKVDMIANLQREGVRVQIRTDRRFYPNYEKLMRSQQLLKKMGIDILEGDIHVRPMGRARTNNLSYEKGLIAGCANLFMMSRQMSNFHSVIKSLSKLGKFCCPVIDVNGDLLAGESADCCKIGTIYDLPEVLFRNMVSIDPREKCNRCGQWDTASLDKKKLADFILGSHARLG